MLIWGFKSWVHQLAMVTFVCTGCHNPTAHALRKVVRKFTLFFIPLFPVSTKYSLQCTYCGIAGQLSKEQADEVLAGLQTPAGPPAGQPAVDQAPDAQA